jgi:hypothetical protein
MQLPRRMRVHVGDSFKLKPARASVRRNHSSKPAPKTAENHSDKEHSLPSTIVFDLATNIRWFLSRGVPKTLQLSLFRRHRM